MTIQEAIKSGKPYRRKEWVFGNWIHPNRAPLEYTACDIMADDWQIKSDPREFYVFNVPQFTELFVSVERPVHFTNLIKVREVLE